MTEALFAAALAAGGEEFLELEGQILAAADVAAPVLAARAQEAEGFERLLAEVLLGRVEGDEEVDRMLEFMAETEREMERLVNDQPSPEWAGGKLLELFGARLVPALAVYAVKLQTVWRSWRTVGAIVYLGRIGGREAATGLVELVAVTPFRAYRRYAADALAEIGDEGALALIEEKLATASENAREALEAAAATIRAKV